MPTQDELRTEFDQDSQQYTSNLQQYSTTVQQTNLANSYANMLVQKVWPVCSVFVTLGNCTLFHVVRT